MLAYHQLGTYEKKKLQWHCNPNTKILNVQIVIIWKPKWVHSRFRNISNYLNLNWKCLQNVDHFVLILTHFPLVPHICVRELGQYWFRWWLVAYSASSHYWNQCWVIVNWTLSTNFNEIWIEIQHFSFMKMHLKISSAKWRPFCPGSEELMLRMSPLLTSLLVPPRHVRTLTGFSPWPIEDALRQILPSSCLICKTSIGPWCNPLYMAYLILAHVMTSMSRRRFTSMAPVVRVVYTTAAHERFHLKSTAHQGNARLSPIEIPMNQKPWEWTMLLLCYIHI